MMVVVVHAVYMRCTRSYTWELCDTQHPHIILLWKFW